MGPVLAGFLSAFSAAIDDDGLAWSIGGTPTVAQGGLLGAQSHVISGTHINNPYFFNGQFTGVLVKPAAYTFIYRFMANHSAENPTSILADDVTSSWFGIQGTSGNYQALQGQESISDNWYRRVIECPYETTNFTTDALNAIALYPKFADIGGDLGTTNSFTGVDVANLTAGILNAGNLLSGNHLGCLAYQFAAQAKPHLALAVLTQITSALGEIESSLTCPQLRAIDDTQLKQFTGYRQ
ncbi:hypothetical protein LTR22_026342 [Elasticomyces elasticus]|nr:hypothetical protein LTR22_026342 [Elasticomyces elasticus]